MLYRIESIEYIAGDPVPQFSFPPNEEVKHFLFSTQDGIQMQVDGINEKFRAGVKTKIFYIVKRDF